MPRSRNTQMRPKDTSRSDARRRYRGEQRALETATEPNTLSDQVQPGGAEEQPRRSQWAMPNVREDVAALPQVFRKPLVWFPFGLLLVAFGLAMAQQNGALLEGELGSISGLFLQVVLAPPPLVVFFAGGFVAPRGSYLVGALLGVLWAALFTILVTTSASSLEEAGITEAGGAEMTAADLAPLWAMGIIGGIFAAGFASWYRRFLRSSQERAAANRAARELEQAEKARQQAREDKAALRAQKQADRETRRKSSR